MSEPLKLSGRQIQILREGIVGAYPDPENLWYLLAVRMEVQVSAIARGDAYKNKVFALIQDFEAHGRIEEFIRVVVENRPNSPYFLEVKKEFPSILGKVEPPPPEPPKNGKKILYIDYRGTKGKFIELTYCLDNLDNPVAIRRSLTRLEQEIKDSDKPSQTPQILYQWLNGSEKILEIQEETVLALAFPETLAQYPWETLNLSNRNLVPVRWFKKNKTISAPKDRALGILFMAAAPREININLNNEQQETKILEITKRHPINLVVEESGWLQELEAILYNDLHNDGSKFDVIHLSGQVKFQNDQTCLLTEDEFGNCCYSNAEDIANALRDGLSKLVFLCGQVEYSWEYKALSSLAAELIGRGIETVLTVGNEQAETILATLYRELARGENLLTAIQQVYREIRNQAKPPESLLGVYLADVKLFSQAFVTRGQQPQPFLEQIVTSIDPEGRIKKFDRTNFVGRRRQLQNCLKALKIDQDKVGVILHGMGGLGKSSIASRIIRDRLPGYKDETLSEWARGREPLSSSKLLEKLSEYLDEQGDGDLRQYLNGQNLQEDLTKLFRQLSKRGKLLLLILDDFEWNLEPEGRKYRILAEPANVLKSLVNAILRSRTKHKIIITCRYDQFDTEGTLDLFYSQGLDQLSGADLEKKLRKLKNFSSDRISSEVRQKALDIAQGNPRLLEDLDKDVLSLYDNEAICKKLMEYETNPDKWKDRVIWPRLYEQIDEPLRKVLSYGLIYRIPVTRAILRIVCEDEDGEEIQRGIDLSLIEESSDLEEFDRLYRISPILSHILESIKLPEDENILLRFSRRAYQQINTLWGNRENGNEERWSEIFRLAFADKGNPERFREQFTQMISVQYNREADRAYEKELRKEKEYLIENQGQIYDRLKEYLQQQDWKKADYETAFIMYQWMVIENYDDFYDLFRGVSLEVINDIDRLWMQYSEGKFGIKGQAKIYRDLGGTEEYNYEIWDRFGDRVGWKQGEQWLKLNEVAYRTTETHNYHLPVLMYCRYWGGLVVWGVTMGGCWVGVRYLFSRVET